MIRRRDSMRRWLEEGRHPHAAAVMATVVLVALAPVRFSVLVSRMDPEAYGYLSLFNTLTSLLPYALTLGLSLQFQLLAGTHGSGAAGPIVRKGTRIVLIATVPGFLLCLALALPFGAAGQPLVLALFSIVTSAAVAITITISQVLLGLRSRSASVLVMFGYNVFLTVTVLPFLGGGRVSVMDVMGAWTTASLIGLGLALLWLRYAPSSLGEAAAATVAAVDIRHFDGLLTLPALVGPLLLLMLTRYLLGLFGSGSALATFALSWTLVDLAFLISVNVPTLASTDIMFGRRSPTPIFALSAIAMVGLVGVGYLALEVFVQTFAPDYRPSFLVTSLMLVAGIARVAITSWLPRAVGLTRERRVSALYAGGAVALAVALAAWRPTGPIPYALCLSLAFAMVAVAQAVLIGWGQASVTTDATGRTETV